MGHHLLLPIDPFGEKGSRPGSYALNQQGVPLENIVFDDGNWFILTGMYGGGLKTRHAPSIGTVLV